MTPGLCHSELMRYGTLPLRVGARVLKAALARTTEEGSRTLVAASVAGEESHGRYMADCVVREPGVWVTSAEGARVQEKFFGELMAVLERIQPGISGNL